MECRQAKERISSYLDQELDAASARQVEAHLHECANCREELREFQEIDGMVHGLPRFDLGPDFARQLSMKLSELAVTGEIERPGRPSVLERLYRLLDDFVQLLSPTRAHTTGTLDEFSDFPPLSMGHIYFKLMDAPTRG
jgi:hypothetical protein